MHVISAIILIIRHIIYSLNSIERDRLTLVCKSSSSSFTSEQKIVNKKKWNIIMNVLENIIIFVGAVRESKSPRTHISQCVVCNRHTKVGKIFLFCSIYTFTNDKTWFHWSYIEFRSVVQLIYTRALSQRAVAKYATCMHIYFFFSSAKSDLLRKVVRMDLSATGVQRNSFPINRLMYMCVSTVHMLAFVTSLS